MSLPDVSIVVQDGLLGQVPPSVANASVKVGVCSDGIVGTIYSANDNGTAQAALGQGPLLDAGAHTLSVAGGPVYFLPINPSAAGGLSPSGVARPIAVGTGTVAVSFAPRQAIQIKITTGGANGTATFAIALGGGTYGANVVTTGGTFNYTVPATLSTITLASGQTWVLNDVYTVATDGTITLSGSGPAASNVTQASSPLDSYGLVQLAITTAGALGAAQFTYSLDGGDSVSGQILVPTSGKYAIPQTGIVLTFASTFTLGDTYTFATIAAGYSNTDITNALTTLNNSSTDFGFVHIVGQASGTDPVAVSNAAAATAAIIDSAMTTALAAFRFIFAVMECPTVLTNGTAIADSTIVSSNFATVAATRVSVCAGDAEMVSPLNGRILRRNIAWAYTARLAAISPGEDPAFVGRGRLPNVVSLYRDEQKTPALDAARFVTARSFPGTPGYFITNGNMMTSPGSDFNFVQRRRVMDIACRIVRAASVPYLNASVRVVKATGFIDERDAQKYEADVNNKLMAAVVATGMASDPTPNSMVVMNRTTNILATNTEAVTVRILPLAYTKFLNINIGFTNPAALAV